ncbi:histidinol dehydrogenase [Acetonema longum]|nr:histidinol dehydrogenase [Acetonema longum]
MRRFDAVGMDQQELANLLRKPPFDLVRLPAAAEKRMEAMFGREMTASQVVAQIIEDVRSAGNEALIRYTRLIDGVELTPETLEISQGEFAAVESQVDDQLKESINLAIENVRRFHREQLPRTWLTYRDHGAMQGQACLPLERVGIYVPGGKASYPSSVIMNAVPATVAGVREIIMAVPPARDGSVNPYVLYAARQAGVHKVYRLGGAQAVAALAFGTETIGRVDKITGPGNIFVTLAKKAVYGFCDIDMLAGPSEILIVADRTADPRYVAADLLSQAEHDELASSILATESPELAARVEKELDRQLALLPRRDIAAASLAANGMIITVADMAQAMEVANLAAPEHLELLTAEPFSLLPLVRHAGAVFLGPYSPEPLGDYLAGPNHVLPTGGTARFYSVLNVESFMKRTSIVAYTKEALAAAGEHIIRLADAEGLGAHANAVRMRREDESEKNS